MSGAMKESVAILYGAHVSTYFRGEFPYEEDMLPDRGDIQRQLGEYGLGLSIAVARFRPSGENELPQIRVWDNPVFDREGSLVGGELSRGELADYPVVYDRWIDNFHGGVLSGDTTSERNAFGIGLPADRIFNYRTVQNLGNNKRATDKILREAGVAIPTYAANNLEEIEAGEGTKSPLVYKPNTSARGVGVVRYADIDSYRRALAAGDVDPSGNVQRGLDVHAPIPDLVGDTQRDKELLRRYNNDASELRPRELRMHAVAGTDREGRLKIEAFPVLKIGKPGRDTLENDFVIGIDPSCVPEGSAMHDGTVDVMRRSLGAANTGATPDQKATQLYACADWLQDAHGRPLVVDANYRSPGLSTKARSARGALVRTWAHQTMQILDRN